ncbi:hypothetical protein MVES1_001371 [Malassezia vespertilionis]|uniref:Mediator of RNA polymerase II transcription subunit 22 n=1 Tax=Malassezia vespertilionis TaxID=2020962 RepID=A0A2N1JE96_9BASI|nr:uncharacterized protein MVES1_001371 [Malassezia vespertilionis]PKI84877.1 hypothetical protein MVES_001288 [Malassezia vespertilionis]WFD06033.1 hypothetical protein MVES1_001371 [Malassezia vespertilionis]
MQEAHPHLPDTEAHGNSAHLDALEETVNKQIDADVEILLENYKEVINLSRIGEKNQFDVGREAFQLESRADSMVRAAQSLYLLSDALKLSLLLSQSQLSDARKQEAEQLLAQTSAYQGECSRMLAEHWFPGANVRGDSPRPDAGDGAMESEV